MKRNSLGLLDRLLDDFPEEQDLQDHDVAMYEKRLVSWDNWCDGFRRDLEMLLASRPPIRDGKPADTIGETVIAYGVSPAPGAGQTPDIAERIFQAVKTFEPRLQDMVLVRSKESGSTIPLCILSGWVEWDGTPHELHVRVYAVGDGFEIGIYE